VLSPTACTDEFRFGLRVEALDSLTDAPVSDGLAGLLLDGKYVEEMGVSDYELYGAGERAGTYAVVVTAPGHRAWVRTGVKVRENECHVIPVSLTARLLADSLP
jgi:hypothetical protein